MSLQKNEDEIKIAKNIFYVKTSLLVLVHIAWLFLSNLLILLLNEIYFKDQLFVFYGFLLVTTTIFTILFYLIESIKKETERLIEELKNEKE